MSFSQYVCQALLNSLFGKTSNFGALASAPPIYVGLSITQPTETGGNITEPSAGSYARVATSAGDWNAATFADPSVISNANPISFPQATADWIAGSPNEVLYFFLSDAASGSPQNFLGSGALTDGATVLSGETGQFAAGALTISLD